MIRLFKAFDLSIFSENSKYMRRIDLIIQAIIGSISLVSLLTFSFYFWLLGTLILGAWQLVSALLNTIPMLSTTYRTRILLYWVLTILTLSILFLRADIAIVICMIISWGIAFYYWLMYRSFINYVEFRKELSTLLK